ncbi:MAG: hypothetical protein ACI8TS_001330 [Flavobacteriales bacterium]|jgi:hypothetical protein
MKLFRLLLLLPIGAFAQTAPPSNLQLEDLRTWLKENWYDGLHNDLGYSEGRIQMYGYTDEVDGEIECIYTGFQQIADFVTYPNPINAEHIIPQSFYGSATPMRSDIHNIRPAHGSVNSARANHPFGEVLDQNANWYGVTGGGAYTSTTTQPNPDFNFSEREGSLFEPREMKKGDVARQVFYFYTMYPTQAGSIAGIGDLNTLYTWHVQDPVDAGEITRNNRIEEVQGNRNPYIDYPLAAFEAWLWVEVLGCIDPAAFNYNANANTDDGSCILTLVGCTYLEANNYDPLATEDDGTCDFSGGVLGCTYLEATNYSPIATEDDGSCLFPNEVLGCTYITAINYSITSTSDDGSCLFNLAPLCQEDLSGDGNVDIIDFLIFLSAFGIACGQ